MSITYMVRTPFGDNGENFHKAMKRIQREAQSQLDIRPKWLKGRDKKTGRYHYWEVENYIDAYAFLLAFGDQMQEVENENTEHTQTNMVKKEGRRSEHRTTD